MFARPSGRRKGRLASAPSHPPRLAWMPARLTPAVGLRRPRTARRLIGPLIGGDEAVSEAVGVSEVPEVAAVGHDETTAGGTSPSATADMQGRGRPRHGKVGNAGRLHGCRDLAAPSARPKTLGGVSYPQFIPGRATLLLALALLAEFACLASHLLAIADNSGVEAFCLPSPMSTPMSMHPTPTTLIRRHGSDD